jgi:hypothetical protein
MGFFSDLWEGIKSTASNVWSGIKSGANAIYDVVRKPVDWVSRGLEYASKIPGIGAFVAPVAGVVNTVKSGLDQAKSIGDAAKAIGLREGGMIQPTRSEVRKYYQAE